MIHILTPTNRWMNLPYLLMNLRKVGLSEKSDDLRWHLLLSESDCVEWEELIDLFPYWVDAVDCDGTPHGNDPCYFKINHYLKSKKLNDGDWYGCIADDNMLSESVFKKLRECESDTEIAIFSELRGTNKIDVNPLILKAEKGNIGIYKTDLCQFFVRGSIYKQHIFDDTCSFADGSLIQSLVEKYQTAYYPKDYVYFNVLQPGRWSYKMIEHLF